MRINISDIVIPEERARATYSEEQHALLEASLSKYGQLSDPIVRPIEGGKYELVDGQARLTQFAEAGMEEIDVRVVDLNDKDSNMVNILMNIARGTQDPIGICLALTKAKDSGMTEEEMCAATGHSREWVKFMLMLSTLPEGYQKALQEDRLKVGHVRQAFRLPTPTEVDACLSVALNQRLNVNIISGYVDNRLAEYEAARILQEEYNVEAPPPAIDAQRLVHTRQCLACNEMVNREEITHPVICNDCYSLLRYVASQVGSGQQGMERIFKALNLQQQYHRQQQDFLLRQQLGEHPPQAPPPQPQQTVHSPEPETMIIKPEDMTPEEWGRLKATLRTQYGG